MINILSEMVASSGDQLDENPRQEPCAADPSYTREAQSDGETAPEEPEFTNQFRKVWLNATDDNYLTLFGFRRFRTAHLLNLRFLEEEIDKIDHKIYQAGMKLDCPIGAIDRLGLKHGKRDVADPGAARVVNVVDKDLMSRLRELLRQYGTCYPKQGSCTD